MHMIDMDHIAQAVRKGRKQKRLSQTDLAHLAGVSRPLLTNLETGKLAELGVTKLLRILNVLGLDLRITELNFNRPTLEELQAEQEERH